MSDRFDCQEAIAYAISLVQMRAECTDSASPEGHAARQALNTLENIRDQQGCESILGCGDGMLTTVMDIAIFG